jgi:hypothetical protein
MNENRQSFQDKSLRTTDTNSLLRMHDSAKVLFARSRTQLEKTWASRLTERIIMELQRRNVSP